MYSAVLEYHKISVRVVVLKVTMHELFMTVFVFVRKRDIVSIILCVYTVALLISNYYQYAGYRLLGEKSLLSSKMFASSFIKAFSNIFIDNLLTSLELKKIAAHICTTTCTYQYNEDCKCLI